MSTATYIAPVPLAYVTGGELAVRACELFGGVAAAVGLDELSRPLDAPEWMPTGSVRCIAEAGGYSWADATGAQRS